MTRLSLTLVPTDGSPSRPVSLPGLPASLGRRPDNDIALPLPSISGRHLRFEAGPTPDSLVLTDLGSTNGTCVEGRRLTPGQPEVIHAPTTLQVGSYRLELRATEAQYSMTTAASNSELLRQVESLAGSNTPRDRTLAFLEILSGPDSGRRLYLPLEDEEFLLGTGTKADLHLRLQGVPEELAMLFFRGPQCWIRPLSESLTLNGGPFPNERSLTSGDRLIVGPMELLFFDPLQSSLATLSQIDPSDLEGPPLEEADHPLQAPDDAAPAAPSATAEPTPEPPEAAKTQNAPRFSPSERLVIFWGLATIFLTAALVFSVWILV